MVIRHNPYEGVMTTNATCAQPDTLTFESLVKKMEEFHAKYPPPPRDPLSIFPLRPLLAGLDLIERPLPPPKIQVSKEAEWIFTPEDLAELNAFLLERFGRREEDRNMYYFGRYLSVPFGAMGDIRSIIGSMGA